MNIIFDRVALWNNRRYKQEFDLALTMQLLREEHKEWLKAKSPVNKLDALCDVIFIAMGAIWKANINLGVLHGNENQVHMVLESQIKCNELWPAYYIGTYMDVMEYDKDYSLAMSLQLIIGSAMAEMTGFGLSHKECMEALTIVCDSNDSKSLQSIKKGEKYSKEGKGPYFKSPESKLQQLLEKARGRLN